MYCPNCGKEIKEGSKFCKHCGAGAKESGVEVEEKRAQSGRESVPSYDSPKIIPLDIMKEGERIVFEAHPHKAYTLLGWWILGAILILVFGAALIGGLIVVRNFNCFTSILTGIMTVIGFLMLVIPYLKWRYTIYGLTTGRVIRLSGIIGKDFYENSLEKIQDIRLKIGVFQRMFGCGDIVITTAGTAGVECKWKSVKNPRETQKILRVLLGK